MMLQQSSPIVVRLADQGQEKVIQQANPLSTAASLLLDSLGLAGVILLAAAAVGLALGGFFILLKRLRPDNPLTGQTTDQARLNLSSLPD